MFNMNFIRSNLLLVGVAILFASFLQAETIIVGEEDFEDVGDLYYVDGFQTKEGTITTVADPRPGSLGSYAANFSWVSDGSYQYQKGYMVKDLGGDYDFTGANISFWYKRTNRSTHVGIQLVDNGQVVEQWIDTPASTVWKQLSLTSGSASGIGNYWWSGAGDITSIDQIVFLHMDSTVPGSGMTHTVYFDDFEATVDVVVPEPWGSLGKFYGYWDHESGPNGGTGFLDYVNVGKSLSVGTAPDIVAQGIPVIPIISGFTSDMNSTEWRNRLDDKKAALRSMGTENVTFILLMDEPYGAGFTTSQLEQIVDDAHAIIDFNDSNLPSFRYGYTFTESTINSAPNLPQNIDVVAINYYPFRVSDSNVILENEKYYFDLRTQTLIDNARSKKSGSSNISITGQSFEGQTNWRTPPSGSPEWYTAWVRDNNDIEGLLWFTWADRPGGIGAQNIPGLPAEQQIAGLSIVHPPLVINFEGDINDLYVVPGSRTKTQTVTASNDVPSSSDGTQSALFGWYTDGAYAGQYAYMVKDLRGDYDFSNALMSYWHMRINRSNRVGIALFDNGNLVAEWERDYATSWEETNINAATYTPTTIGTGSITSVDAIGFMHKNTLGPGSGLNHQVYFDDFRASNVVAPEANEIAVVAPNGNETLKVEDTYVIVWESPAAVNDVTIEYSTNNAVDWTEVSPANTGNAGTYAWQVPLVKSNECLVRVTDSDNPGDTDVSDTTFTIYSECRSQIPGDLNGDCYINYEDILGLVNNWLLCSDSTNELCTE